jgi:hypothetical protein
MADEKKIIVDEDWKSQVQAEKEQAAKSKTATKPDAAAAESGEMDDSPMPPATFELLLTTLATEALVAMGQVPHPATGKLEAQRNQSKYLIDTLDVLREKTKGNLSADEQQLLESMLHQLRMLFIQTEPAQTAANS